MRFSNNWRRRGEENWRDEIRETNDGFKVRESARNGWAAVYAKYTHE